VLKARERNRPAVDGHRPGVVIDPHRPGNGHAWGPWGVGSAQERGDPCAELRIAKRLLDDVVGAALQ